jgi:methyltransferase (TIGR00027 family)
MTATERAASDAILSAQTVCFMRALGNRDLDVERPNPDHLAKHFLRLKWKLALLLPFRLARGLVEKKAPGSYWFSMVRTWFGDDTLTQALQEGAEQVVIFGAGADSRAFRFAEELRGASVFELDWPGTQLMKRQRLQRFSEVAERVEYIPADLNHAAWADALEARGYDARKSTVFIAEGVLYYLRPEAVQRILSFVAQNTGKATYVVCDFTTRRFIDGDHSTYGGAQLKQWLDSVGEQYIVGVDREDLPKYIDSLGLELVAAAGPNEGEGKLVPRGQSMLGNFYFARMRPKAS